MRNTTNTRFIERVMRGEPLLGTLLSLPSPEIVEVAVGAGFDWLFIDMEHGLLDFTAAQRMVQAAGTCPCLVRVPSTQSIEVARALDTGAAGIIVPHVNGAGDARPAVDAAKYPPLGSRSMGAGRAQGYGRTGDEAVAHHNAETIVVAQAEHIEAVRNLAEILAVDGVAAVFIGPFDLSASLGKPGAITEPEVQEAVGRVVNACRAAGKPYGIFAVDAAGAAQAFKAGHSLVCVSTDTIILGRALAGLVKDAQRGA